MQARGPLMIEHRLIERMISLIAGVLARIESTRKVDPLFVDTAVDFIRMYADRTHHRKEEDILFREMSRRRLSAEDQRVMNELIQEHIFVRQTTKALVEANIRHRTGDVSAFTDVIRNLRSLVEFYPLDFLNDGMLAAPSRQRRITSSHAIGTCEAASTSTASRS